MAGWLQPILSLGLLVTHGSAPCDIVFEALSKEVVEISESMAAPKDRVIASLLIAHRAEILNIITRIEQIETRDLRASREVVDRIRLQYDIEHHRTEISHLVGRFFKLLAMSPKGRTVWANAKAQLVPRDGEMSLVADRIDKLLMSHEGKERGRHRFFWSAGDFDALPKALYMMNTVLAHWPSD